MTQPGIRTTHDFSTGRSIPVYWKEPRPSCPNCLGAGHVTLSRPVADFWLAYWAPCPACNKTFGQHKTGDVG